MDLFAYCEVSLNPKIFLLTWTFRAFMAQIWGHIYNTVHIILVNPYNNSYKTNEISFLSECFINALNFTSLRSRGQFWRLPEEVSPSTNKCW
jgi:hypothetical protein